MKKLGYNDLSSLSIQAQQSPRKRMNHNLHSELSDPIQRLVIAMEPDTYIRPHHHQHTWELLTSLRGRFVVLTFDDDGVVIGRMLLSKKKISPLGRLLPRTISIRNLCVGSVMPKLVNVGLVADRRSA